MFKEFFENLWTNFKRDIIYIAILVGMVVSLSMSVRSCTNEMYGKKIMVENVEALCDSISYYKGKNGELVAEKQILIGDNDLLKVANEELYNKLKSMKVKNAEQAIQIEALISNPQRDTTWIVDTIPVYIDVAKYFKFENPYRLLDGNVYIKDKNLGLQILNDKIYFDYTLAIKGNTIYITSDNPYVQFKDVYAITQDKPKPKRFGLGLQVGFGGIYGLINKNVDVGPYVGVGFTYGFTW